MSISIKPSKRPEIPCFDIPDRFITSDEYLHYLVMQGLERKYPNNVSKVTKQAEYELVIIKKLEYTDYFLIISDIVAWAQEHDIIMSSGRGSSPASLVAYALGITNIDPIKFGLIFECFANLEYPAIPDIDIDFSFDGREKVINYVSQKYGKNRVGLVSIYSVLKDGRKFFGTHAAGLVISKNNLDNYGEVYNDPETNMLITKLDSDALKNHRLIRFDFLGLKILDEIKNAIESIGKRGGQFTDFSINNIQLDDKETIKLFNEGKTYGVYQFDGNRIWNILQQIKPDCFEHLIAINVLFRTGNNDLILEYAERRHGRKHIDYLHPCLEDILKGTYGLIVYDEQIMRIVQRIAGYSLGEADVFKRNLMKARKVKQDIKEEKKRFIIKAIEQGFEKQNAEQIFDHLASALVFSKSHAVSYTLLSYQTAYIKANF